MEIFVKIVLTISYFGHSILDIWLDSEYDTVECWVPLN